MAESCSGSTGKSSSGTPRIAPQPISRPTGKVGIESPVAFGQPIPPSLAGLQKSPQPSGNQYVMTDAVKNGINVRAKATSESKLMYMLAKVDAMHPVVTITKMSDDKTWGFMDTGDPDKSGWLFMEYLRLL